jgi:hypothetical protein
MAIAYQGPLTRRAIRAAGGVSRHQGAALAAGLLRLLPRHLGRTAGAAAAARLDRSAGASGHCADGAGAAAGADCGPVRRPPRAVGQRHQAISRSATSPPARSRPRCRPPPTLPPLQGIASAAQWAGAGRRCGRTDLRLAAPVAELPRPQPGRGHVLVGPDPVLIHRHPHHHRHRAVGAVRVAALLPAVSPGPSSSSAPSGARRSRCARIRSAPPAPSAPSRCSPVPC